MATDRRVARVAELIKREVSQLLFSGIKDDRVGMGMVSVTDVDVAGDLQHAKIFVSIYGSDEARAETMAGLKSATSYVRGEIGRRVRLRRTPEIIFLEDRSIERGTKVLSLINRLSEERKTAEAPEGQPGPDAAPDVEEREGIAVAGDQDSSGSSSNSAGNSPASNSASDLD